MYYGTFVFHQIIVLGDSDFVTDAFLCHLDPPGKMYNCICSACPGINTLTLYQITNLVCRCSFSSVRHIFCRIRQDNWWRTHSQISYDLRVVPCCRTSTNSKLVLQRRHTHGILRGTWLMALFCSSSTNSPKNSLHELALARMWDQEPSKSLFEVLYTVI